MIMKHTRIYDQTTAVRDALEQLERVDCRVLDIRLGGREPVIHIDPAETPKALDGAMYMRERINGRIVATYVARVCGCQVRWAAPLDDAPRAINGHHSAPALSGVPS